MLAVVLLAALAQTSTAQTDPYQIFAQAREAWAAARYPQYLQYTVAVRVVEHGVGKSNHYHLTYDTSLGKVGVDPISDEERAAPPQATGATVHFLPKRQGKTLLDKRIGAAPDAIDYLGVPVISPTYAFGMLPGSTVHSVAVDGIDSDALVQQIRNEYHDPVPQAKTRQSVDDGQIKSIANVISTARRYDITLVGMETISGTLCYHLLLRPAPNEPQLRLRELWIDAQTHQTVQLISWGNFGVQDVPWLVHFTHAGDATYITSEEALKPFDYNDHRYDNAVVEFNNVAATTRPARAMGNLFVSKNVLMAEPEF